MNVRKPVDYSAMYTALDKLTAANLPQMELYCEIGRLVSGRPEKGAAVAAAEYLSAAHPDVSGFSPRNLRRMREFYRAYESAPEVLAQAVTISWTQNVVILESELTIQERAWYIQAVRQFGWSKLELIKQIKSNAHLDTALDSEPELCYTEQKSDSAESLDKESETGPEVSYGIHRCKHPTDWNHHLFSSVAQTGRAQHRLCRGNSAVAHLRRLRPPNWDGIERYKGPLESVQGQGDETDVPLYNVLRRLQHIRL